MDFSTAIESKMQDVNDGSSEPFIIYRDKNGGWHCDYTHNQFGMEFDWVEKAKEQDPFAIIYTGKDFSKASFPSVYDTILYDRISIEYYVGRGAGRDSDKLNALKNFFCDNVSSFSHKATDYLTTLECPFSALSEMCPYNLATGVEDWSYNMDLAPDVVESIENAVSDRLLSLAEKPSPEKNSHEGYVELNKISINNSDIILAENPDAEFRYMIVENRYTTYFNALGDNNIYTGYTNDYIEALTEFISKAYSNIECVQSTRNVNESLHGVSYTELNANNCLPDSQNNDYTGKLIVVKANELKPEYRSAEHQLVLCSHGNGARPNAIGQSVFGKELFSGDSVCYGRHQIAGIADHSKLPSWAKTRIDEHNTEQAKSAIKPSLQEKLSKAKEKAAQEAAKNTERVNKSKKRKDMEVT